MTATDDSPQDRPRPVVPTRWEQHDQRGYGAHFARLIRQGQDVEGEARLVDTLAPRAATILDAGSGMGRVGAALQRRGHRVVGVDLDAALVEQSRLTYPDLPVLHERLDHLTPQLLREANLPSSYDLVVCVGNVMILLADGAEQTVLTALRSVLAPEGRLVVGFHTHGVPTGSRDYHPDEFADDAAAVGLRVQQRFSSYELAPYVDSTDYVVTILQRHEQDAPELTSLEW